MRSATRIPRSDEETMIADRARRRNSERQSKKCQKEIDKRALCAVRTPYARRVHAVCDVHATGARLVCTLHVLHVRRNRRRRNNIDADRRLGKAAERQGTFPKNSDEGREARSRKKSILSDDSRRLPNRRVHACACDVHAMANDEIGVEEKPSKPIGDGKGQF